MDLYNTLASENKPKLSSEDKIFDQDKNLLLEKHNDRVKIYNHDEIICDAVFDEKGIVNGWAKIFDKEGHLIFEVKFENHQRNVKGKEYLLDKIITKEGS